MSEYASGFPGRKTPELVGNGDIAIDDQPNLFNYEEFYAEPESHATDFEVVGDNEIQLPDVLNETHQFEGRALRLDLRAVALDDAMRYFNQESKLLGAQRHRMYGGMALDQRYGTDTREVMDGMNARADDFSRKYRAALGSLAMGTGTEQVIGTELSARFGPDNSKAAERKKAMTRIHRTARAARAKHGRA